MPYTVIKRGAQWLTINTRTHQIKGRHASKGKAETQRRVLESLRKKGKAR